MSVWTKTTTKLVLISRMWWSGPWPDWWAESWLEISHALTDLSFCSLTGLKLFLRQKKTPKPLSGDVKGGPGVRKAPSSCSHNARLITSRSQHQKFINKWKKKMGWGGAQAWHRGADGLRCHGNPLLQLSSAHPFPQQHNMVERADNYCRHNAVERVKWRPY